MDKELLKQLDESHAELVNVCKALMTRVLNGKKFDKKLDVLLYQLEVSNGFADRAEAVRRNIAWEARKEAAYGDTVQ